MKNMTAFLRALLQLVLLAALVLGMVWMFRAASRGGQNVSPGARPSQVPSATITETIAAYPPPVDGTQIPEATPPSPDVTSSEIPLPTLTVLPTFPPRPTATRRPGPTETAMPPPIPTGDPSGLIFYTRITNIPNPDFPDFPSCSFANFALRVDTKGNVMEAGDINNTFIELDELLENNIFAIYPSTDLRFFVLMSSSEPGGRPYVFDRASGEIREPLAEYAPGLFLGWHPDGRRFLFFVDGGGPWLVDAETSAITHLVYEILIQGGAISPDGLTVAYIADSVGMGDYHGEALFFVSSSGSDTRQIFATGHQSRIYPNAWSPDGSKIVYYGSCNDLTLTGPLCLFDMQTGNISKLNIPSFYGGIISWSSDGHYIAAPGFIHGGNQCTEQNLSELEIQACKFDEARIIYIEEIPTGNIRQLTSGYDPVWSPDGSRLVFISNRSGAQEIWSIQLDGSGLRQLTFDGQSKGPLQVWLREVENESP